MASLVVEPGKTYLLRVISATSLSFLDMAIQGHNLTIVEADGRERGSTRSGEHWWIAANGADQMT
jgi:FtsP/CotA-like multicopper oxidase with cupredoxin domain